MFMDDPFHEKMSFAAAMLKVQRMSLWSSFRQLLGKKQQFHMYSKSSPVGLVLELRYGWSYSLVKPRKRQIGDRQNIFWYFMSFR